MNGKMRQFLFSSILVLFVLLSAAGTLRADIDVTDKVELVKSRLSFDRQNQTSYCDVSVRNISADAVLAPLKVIIESISDPNVTVTNADGVTLDGKPYYVYEGQDARLQAGAITAAKQWVFDNPLRKRFMYTASVVSPDAAEVIGPEGGMVEVIDPDSKLHGIQIYFPESALTEQAIISISAKELPEQEIPQNAFGPIVNLGPDGIIFEEQVTISIPTDTEQIKEGDDLYIIYRSNEDITWSYMTDVVIQNGKATFGIWHFTDVTFVSISDNILNETIRTSFDEDDMLPLIQNDIVGDQDRCQVLCKWAYWYNAVGATVKNSLGGRKHIVNKNLQYAYSIENGDYFQKDLDDLIEKSIGGNPCGYNRFKMGDYHIDGKKWAKALTNELKDSKPVQIFIADCGPKNSHELLVYEWIVPDSGDPYFNILDPNIKGSPRKLTLHDGSLSFNRAVLDSMNFMCIWPWKSKWNSTLQSAFESHSEKWTFYQEPVLNSVKFIDGEAIAKFSPAYFQNYQQYPYGAHGNNTNRYLMYISGKRYKIANDKVHSFSMDELEHEENQTVIRWDFGGQGCSCLSYPFVYVAVRAAVIGFVEGPISEIMGTACEMPNNNIYSFVENIDLDYEPMGIALSPDGQYLVATYYENADKIAIIRLSDGYKRVVNVGSLPREAAFSRDSSRVYVTNYYGPTVSVINTATGSVIKTISGTFGGGATDIALHPNGDFLYVCDYNYSGKQVVRISTLDNSISGTIPVKSTCPVHVVFSPDGNRAYVVLYNDKSVEIIDTSTHSVIDNISLSAFGSGRTPGLVLTPDGKYLYVTDIDNQKIWVIDVQSKSKVGEIPIRLPRPWFINMSPDGNHIFVTSYYTLSSDNSSLSIIDTSTNQVVQEIDINPRGIATSNDGSTLYVANYSDKKISVYSKNVSNLSGKSVFNSDGKATLSDFNFFANSWMRTDCRGENDWCNGFDFNHDGKVDKADFDALKMNWMK